MKKRTGAIPITAYLLRSLPACARGRSVGLVLELDLASGWIAARKALWERRLDRLGAVLDEEGLRSSVIASDPAARSRIQGFVPDVAIAAIPSDDVG
jgi:hypothetical protein